jgi:hypothetical protein
MAVYKTTKKYPIAKERLLEEAVIARFRQATNGMGVATLEITNNTSAAGHTTSSTPTHWRDGVVRTTYVAVINVAMIRPRARNSLLTSIKGSNDQVERRRVVTPTNEADLSQSSIPPWFIEDPTPAIARTDY